EGNLADVLKEAKDGRHAPGTPIELDGDRFGQYARQVAWDAAAGDMGDGLQRAQDRFDRLEIGRMYRQERIAQRCAESPMRIGAHVEPGEDLPREAEAVGVRASRRQAPYPVARPNRGAIE